MNLLLPLVVLLALLPGGIGAFDLVPTGDPRGGAAGETPSGDVELDTSRRFELCAPIYSDGATKETCRLVYPGEATNYGTVGDLDGVSPTGLPIITWDIGGDPPMGNMQGMDLPTMLLIAARGCADDDEQLITLRAVALTGTTIAEVDAPYPRDAADITRQWYETEIASTMVFAAAPLTGRAVPDDHPAESKPSGRKGLDLLVGVECGGDTSDSFDKLLSNASGVGAHAEIELPASEDEVLSAFEVKVATVAAQPEQQLSALYDASMPHSVSGPNGSPGLVDAAQS